MHLKNRPTYFTKNGIRKPVYYSVDARQLVENGWIREQVAEAKTPVVVEAAAVAAAPPETEKIEPETTSQSTKEVDFGGMTRAELIRFAEENNLEFKSYGSKAEILEVCMKAVCTQDADDVSVSDGLIALDLDKDSVLTND